MLVIAHLPNVRRWDLFLVEIVNVAAIVGILLQLNVALRRLGDDLVANPKVKALASLVVGAIGALNMCMASALLIVFHYSPRT